ncbi:LysM domain-containing protein [Vibrio ostreicida]|uniref:LysM domain-containing protein n=1 Tax=Vibrio ostreicida TaxID=526588 RepID=A0ABT8BWW8_9VIBR|nr:LysM domain-containing protein [Vibrio ostreicida]MDN3611521.1 LysM domain-containing protein [Vibrio ostreicida]NPD09016.1 LysM peptidoglycan-binding domain-containing protein [Vibrio ostreicida]
MSNKLIYTVNKGDTFSSITENINSAMPITVSQFMKANPNASPTDLQRGQELNIPLTSSSSYQLSPSAEMMGFWYPYTSPSPTNATLSIALYGWGPQKVIEWGNSNNVKDNLIGEKYLAFGGGGVEGKFTGQVLDEINTAIKEEKIKGYHGIAYDIEIADAGLNEQFSMSFNLAKKLGYKVLVTVSHSAPYDDSDRDSLMSSFFANEDIDILSPQLYSSGIEPANDFSITSGSNIRWQDYASAKAKIVPSIVHGSYYPNAKQKFKTYGVELAGYIQWKAN